MFGCLRKGGLTSQKFYSSFCWFLFLCNKLNKMLQKLFSLILIDLFFYELFKLAKIMNILKKKNYIFVHFEWNLFSNIRPIFSGTHTVSIHITICFSYKAHIFFTHSKENYKFSSFSNGGRKKSKKGRWREARKRRKEEKKWVRKLPCASHILIFQKGGCFKASDEYTPLIIYRS